MSNMTYAQLKKWASDCKLPGRSKLNTKAKLQAARNKALKSGKLVKIGTRGIRCQRPKKPKKQSLNKVRKFNGKVFNYHDWYMTKAKAQEAKKLMKGYFIRIIQSPKGWTAKYVIYRRKK